MLTNFVTTLRVVWIEMMYIITGASIICVTTLRVVWIEISLRSTMQLRLQSPPCGWCGLKSVMEIDNVAPLMSPPCGWCGLKCVHTCIVCRLCGSPPCGWCGLKFTQQLMSILTREVTTLRVVWIEIIHHGTINRANLVTTLRVVWIEIIAQGSFVTSYAVTTLRVVWIEIYLSPIIDNAYMVTTLRVVWIEILDVIIRAYTVKPSPPCGWCGLKLKLIRI